MDTNLELVKIVQSEDKSKKYCFKVKDSCKFFEAVCFFNEDKPYECRICISTQIGCTVGCEFCMTGKMGFTRNLTCEEMLDCVGYIVHDNSSDEFKLVNILLMGMGEPLLNYKQIVEFYHKANSTYHPEKICLSTSGIPSSIIDLANSDTDFELFISLHAATNQKRSSIMPINKKYPIEEVLRSAEEFFVKKKRKIVISYMLIDGINDSLKDAEDLVKIVSPEIFEIQILMYNDNNIKGFRRPNIIKAEKMQKFFEENGFNVDINVSKGTDIKGACGQLAGEIEEKK